MFANGVPLDEPDETSSARMSVASRCNSESRPMMSSHHHVYGPQAPSPMRCNSIESARPMSSSHVYPQAPSPMRFTELYYPKPTVFMPSPAPNFKPRRRLGWSCACCCCASLSAALCSLLLVVGALVGVAALITWLILRPVTAPHYSIDTIEVKAFTTSSSRNQSTLSATINYSVTANNPNHRLGFRYDRVGFETSYQGYVFGRSAQARFYQPHRNVTTFESGFAVQTLAFPPEHRSVASNLSADGTRGQVPLHLRAVAKVRVKVGAITSWAITVQVNCNFVVIRPGHTTLSVANKTCSLSR